MSGPFIITALTISVLIGTSPTGGCGKNTASENNATIMNNTIPGQVTNPEAPTIIPGQGPAYPVYSRVNPDDCLIGGDFWMKRIAMKSITGVGMIKISEKIGTWPPNGIDT